MSLSPVYAQWRQDVIDEGRKEGHKEGCRSVALKMLQQGFPIETIAQLTELTQEQIQQLQ